MPIDGLPAWIILAAFLVTYLGMALGRLPGLTLDRAGIALVAAILLVAGGALPAETALGLIDFPTLVILFALMLLSAQAEIAGLYGWAAAKLASSPAGPSLLLAATVALAGGLSMLLINDVVVFAMVPPLIRGLKARGLDPKPFVLAVAAAANAGSAMTLIGNPQNVLLGESFDLPFAGYVADAAVPGLAALILCWAVILPFCKAITPTEVTSGPSEPADRSGLVKAGIAAIALVGLFLLPVERAAAAALIGAAMLISRRHATQHVLRRVDWSLLLLFAGLFVVTGAFAQAGFAAQILAWADAVGIGPSTSTGLMLLAAAGSNTIGNVPLVMLLIQAGALDGPSAVEMAVYSTLAGNLLLVGSIANLIAVERAAGEGVPISFLDHARIGLPIGIASLGAAWAWFAVG